MRDMMKLVVMVAVLGTVTFLATAQPAPAAPAEGTSVTAGSAVGPTMAKALGIFGACVGAAGAAIGGGFGIARIGSRCMDAIARQPEAAGSMFAPMIVTAAMVEGGMLFAMVVCLLGVLGI